MRLERSTDLKPGALSYGTVAATCIENDFLSTAEEFLSDAETRDFKDKDVMYAKVMSAYERMGYYEMVHSTFGRMEKQNVEPSLSCWLPIVLTHFRLNQIDEAAQVLDSLRVKDQGLMDDNFWNTIITCCVSCNHFPTAIQLMKNLTRDISIVTSSQQYDLHRCRVGMACMSLASALFARDEGLGDLMIVTGRGLHSKSKTPVQVERIPQF